MNWFKLKYKKLIILGISYISLILFFVFPLPFELLLPGGVEPTNNVIKLENYYEMTGSINKSYVSVVTRPSPFQYLLTKFNNKAEIWELSEKENQMSIQEINYKNNLYKISSVNNAIISAYNEADKDIYYKELGVVLIDRIYGTIAYEKFEIGDIIIKINDKSVYNYDDLISMLQNISCEELFTVTLIRDDKEIDVEISKRQHENKCILGLYKGYTFTNLEFDFTKSNPQIIEIDYSGYGPSAGLMQALTIYNLITPIDITYGLKIAGTGTIDIEGNVGPIGGIKQKIYGACKDDVDLFFTPYEHLEDAKEARDAMKSEMLIVPVNNIREVLAYLRENYG